MSREITGKTVFGTWLFSQLGPNSSGKRREEQQSFCQSRTIHCQGRCRAGAFPQLLFHQELKRGTTFHQQTPGSLSCTGHPAHRSYTQGCHLTVSPSCPSRLQPWRALVSKRCSSLRPNRGKQMWQWQDWKKAEIKVMYFSLELTEPLSKMPVFLPA